MCGRVFDPEEVSQIKLNPLKGRQGDRWLWTLQRRYNVPPTMPLPVMTAKEGVRTVEPMRWGLIPSWAGDPKKLGNTFNARADTIDAKPAFKGSWKAGRRCLVLVGGFYEWRRSGVADKQPFAFAMGNRDIMTLGGLWEPWKNPETGEWTRSCTIITTDANDLMARVHDRMPAIIGSENREKWLGEEPANDNELKAMLAPFPPQRLSAWPVSQKVGNVKNDTPDLIERAAEQGSLL